MRENRVERRFDGALRAKVSQVAVRLGIPQREAYRLIRQNHLYKAPGA